MPTLLSTPLHELIPPLQVAIGPVILVSGIGLLLLTLRNRFARTIDRSRELVRLMGNSPANEQQPAGQVEILYRRTRLARLSIISALAALALELACKAPRCGNANPAKAKSRMGSFRLSNA